MDSAIGSTPNLDDDAASNLSAIGYLMLLVENASLYEGRTYAQLAEKPGFSFFLQPSSFGRGLFAPRELRMAG
ncbi:hypothetical protein CKA32_003915 [Geitlerinema sp. FC II]|nr:hypothetical protein [Geitlerinema sp. CS-897]PPT05896.1 hypothetical protein CKA32_003915 [Geitlerinema sp. FC II]